MRKFTRSSKEFGFKFTGTNKKIIHNEKIMKVGDHQSLDFEKSSPLIQKPKRCVQFEQQIKNNFF